MIAERDTNIFFRSTPINPYHICYLPVLSFPNEPTGIGSYHLISVSVFSNRSKVFEPGLENLLVNLHTIRFLKLVACVISFFTTQTHHRHVLSKLVAFVMCSLEYIQPFPDEISKDSVIPIILCSWKFGPI